jgi:hypothetical protein
MLIDITVRIDYCLTKGVIMNEFEQKDVRETWELSVDEIYKMVKNEVPKDALDDIKNKMGEDSGGFIGGILQYLVLKMDKNQEQAEEILNI